VVKFFGLIKVRSVLGIMLTDEFKIKTGRIYIHGKDKFKTLGENINDLKFWLDFEYFMIYNE
jgi:hypothetical protein